MNFAAKVAMIFKESSLQSGYMWYIDKPNGNVFCFRRLWAVRRLPHRESSGEVAVRSGGILPHSISEPTNPLRQAAATAAVSAHRLQSSHRTALLRAAGRQDSHRDADPRHAAQRKQLQLALHELDVTQHLAPARHDLIDAPGGRRGNCDETLALVSAAAGTTLGDSRALWAVFSRTVRCLCVSRCASGRDDFVFVTSKEVIRLAIGNNNLNCYIFTQIKLGKCHYNLLQNYIRYIQDGITL